MILLSGKICSRKPEETALRPPAIIDPIGREKQGGRLPLSSSARLPPISSHKESFTLLRFPAGHEENFIVLQVPKEPQTSKHKFAQQRPRLSHTRALGRESSGHYSKGLTLLGAW